MVLSVSIPLLADLVGGLKQFIVDALDMVCKYINMQKKKKKKKKKKKNFLAFPLTIPHINN